MYDPKIIEIGGKTYKVYRLNGHGLDCIDVRVATFTGHIWRGIRRDGKTWKKVMRAAKEIK